MHSFVKVQKHLTPDLLPIMQRRYEILQSVQHLGPVGRRTLASILGLTERVLRSEIDFLKKQELISVQSSGMTITQQGVTIMHHAQCIMREISGISTIEQELKRLFEPQQVIIVPGDSDEASWVKAELGTSCARSIRENLSGKNVIAVSGGTTLAMVAEMLNTDYSINHELLFVPARGGFGEELGNQANTICAKMAGKTNGKYSSLFVPDQLTPEGYQSIIKEPVISEVLQLLQQANMIVHGIGDALTMANKRREPASTVMKLEKGLAVGEAFGYYFNEAGEVVHKVPTVGIQLEDLDTTDCVIAVAGGSSKAKAINAFMRSKRKTSILITDEGAAKKMLSIT